MDPTLLRRAYDREAAQYDARFAGQQQPKYEALSRVVEPPPPGARVLDLGGGTGLLAAALAALDPRWTTARFTCVDLSTGMLRVARGRGLDAAGADARQLPFRRGAFERVVCVTGLVGAEHVGRALAAAVRVLAPGGLLAVSLRPRDVPSDLDSEQARLPVDSLHAGDAAGDRLFVWRRR